MILVKIIIDNKILYDGNAQAVYLNTTDKGIMALQEGCPNYILRITESIEIILSNNKKQTFQIKEAIANFNSNLLEIIG